MKGYARNIVPSKDAQMSMLNYVEVAVGGN